MPSGTPTLDFAAHWVLFAALAWAAFVFVRRARKEPTRPRLIAGNLLVLLALLSGVLAAGETYLRFVFDQSTWHAEALTTRAWLWRHCHLNTEGFRDREFVRAKPEGVTRVVALGDSFTFGYGIADPADRVTDLLAAALERRAPGTFEIWNAATIGANTATENQTLRRLMRDAAIDRVLLFYSPNDVEDLLPLERHQLAPFAAAAPGSLRSRSFLLDHLVMRSALVDTTGAERFFDEVDAIHRDPARFAEQAARISALAKLCGRAGIRLDVAVWPLVSHWGPEYPYDTWHDRITEAWITAGVDPIDLRDALAGESYESLRVNSLDAHPNERANALVAEALLPLLFPE